MSTAKRAVDLAFSAGGLVALAPLLGAIAAAIALLDGRPVLFRQERVGRDGRPFRILKFRTMRPPAQAPAEPADPGPQLTVGADPRITRVGRFLRAYKLDELPQLWNVLRGEMSLVGPRPEVPRYVALYDGEQRRVLELAPGITDPASIRFANESELLAGAEDPERYYVEEIMPLKVRMNLQYAPSATIWSDLRVIVATVFGGEPPLSASSTE